MAARRRVVEVVKDEGDHKPGGETIVVKPPEKPRLSVSVFEAAQAKQNEKKRGRK